MPKVSRLNDNIERLDDVELYWVKLDPDNPETDDYDRTKWSVVAKVSEDIYNSWLSNKRTKARANDDGTFSIKFERKAVTAKGKAISPPPVVDGNKQPLDMTSLKVANGSRGNVAYKVDKKPIPKGTYKGQYTFYLEGLQITTLIPYNDPIDSFEEVETTILEPYTEEVDDDLPF